MSDSFKGREGSKEIRKKIFFIKEIESVNKTTELNLNIICKVEYFNMMQMILSGKYVPKVEAFALLFFILFTWYMFDNNQCIFEKTCWLPLLGLWATFIYVCNFSAIINEDQ